MCHMRRRIHIPAADIIEPMRQLMSHHRTNRAVISSLGVGGGEKGLLEEAGRQEDAIYLPCVRPVHLGGVRGTPAHTGVKRDLIQRQKRPTDKETRHLGRVHGTPALAIYGL